jgi:hypothetical protein
VGNQQVAPCFPSFWSQFFLPCMLWFFLSPHRWVSFSSTRSTMKTPCWCSRFVSHMTLVFYFILQTQTLCLCQILEIIWVAQFYIKCLPLIQYTAAQEDRSRGTKTWLLWSMVKWVHEDLKKNKILGTSSRIGRCG